MSLTIIKLGHNSTLPKDFTIEMHMKYIKIA